MARRTRRQVYRSGDREHEGREAVSWNDVIGRLESGGRVQAEGWAVRRVKPSPTPLLVGRATVIRIALQGEGGSGDGGRVSVQPLGGLEGLVDLF